jgi:glycosyltransferase involved in cell wall biosynthesis
MTRVPRFSILIPAYNASETLRETLDSVLSQTRADWEAVIVDDGSTDGTHAIATHYAAAEPRVRVYSQANAGCASARNRAAAEARGDFLCLLDADDLYEPDYFAEQAAFIDLHPDYDIYSCNASTLAADGALSSFNPPQFHERVVSFTFDDMIKENRIAVFAIFRRRVLDAIGGFDSGVYVEDYDFWLRALRAGFKHIHNPRALVRYRVRQDSKSADWTKASQSVHAVLQRLIDGGGMTRRQERIARGYIRRIERCWGYELRTALEERLLAGEYAGARAEFWRARGGYVSRLKFALVAVVMAVSPALYRALFLRNRGRSTG